MKFSIGDLVIDKSYIRAHTSYCIDKVVGILDDALLVEHYGFGFSGEINEDRPSSFMKPGSRSWQSSIRRFQEHELFTPNEVITELKKLESAKSKLDSEFEAVRNQVKEKLDAAASLVKEAGTIVKSHDKEFCDMKKECRPLFEALDNGGWSHSSMSC